MASIAYNLLAIIVFIGTWKSSHNTTLKFSNNQRAEILLHAVVTSAISKLSCDFLGLA